MKIEHDPFGGAVARGKLNDIDRRFIINRDVNFLMGLWEIVFLILLSLPGETGSDPAEYTIKPLQGHK